ncbi:MAG: PD40 domain-containing protein, partial [Planctomycetales bacterium]|nr:PD40 domain-containing protein [Planctomycetales bacterium]
DLESKQPLHTLTGHRDRLTCVAFSPNGRTLATGGIDKRVLFWDVMHGVRLETRDHLDEVQGLAFAPNGEVLAAADRGGAIVVWPVPVEQQGSERPPLNNASETAPIQRVHAHEGRVYSVVFAHDSDELYSTGADGRVYRWHLAPAEMEIQLPTHGRTFDLAFITPDQLVTAADQGVRVYDSRSGALKQTLEGDTQRWQSVTVSPSRWLAAGGLDGNVVVWDLRTWKAWRRWHFDDSVDLNQLAFSPDGKLLAVALWSVGRVRLMDVGTGNEVGRWEAELVNAVTFSPDGRYVVADSLNDVLIWDMASGMLVHRMAGHASTIRALSFPPNDDRLISSSKDRTAKVWDTAEGALLTSLSGHRAEVWTLACSPNGRTLTTADQSGTILLHDLATSRPLLRLDQARRPIDKLAFSPDGRQLAYVDSRGRVFVIRPFDR